MAKRRGHTKEYVEVTKNAEPTKYGPDTTSTFPGLTVVTDEWYAWHKRKLAWEDEKYGRQGAWGED